MMNKTNIIRKCTLCLTAMLCINLLACDRASDYNAETTSTELAETQGDTLPEPTTTTMEETATIKETKTISPETVAPATKETVKPTVKETLKPTQPAPTETYTLGNGAGINGGDIVGNCVCNKKALPIYAVSTGSKCIALSFNTAWGAGDIVQILDILDKYNIKTTFFMTGDWVVRYPDMVKEIHKRGHDLGSHGLNHVRMSKISIAMQQKEITTLTTTVRNLTGYEMFLFRPPYGDYNSTVVNTIYGCNYYPIQWSVDSLDWKNYGADNLINTVTKHSKLKNGAIIQFHNDTQYTASTLETIIQRLQQDGYTILPVSQLIIKSNFHMGGDGTQYSN